MTPSVSATETYARPPSWLQCEALGQMHIHLTVLPACGPEQAVWRLMGPPVTLVYY